MIRRGLLDVIADMQKRIGDAARGIQFASLTGVASVLPLFAMVALAGGYHGCGAEALPGPRDTGPTQG